jgi:hypothetical protein
MTIPNIYQLTALALNVSNANTNKIKQRCLDDDTNLDIIVQIENRCRNLNRFNVQVFVQGYQRSCSSKAIERVLDAIWHKMQTCTDDEVFKAMEWWKYGEQVFEEIRNGINEHQGIEGISKVIKSSGKISASKHTTTGRCIGKKPQQQQKSTLHKPCDISLQQDIKQLELPTIKDTRALDTFIKKQNLNQFEKKRMIKGKMYALRQKYFSLFYKQCEV